MQYFLCMRDTRVRIQAVAFPSFCLNIIHALLKFYLWLNSHTLQIEQQDAYFGILYIFVIL